MRRLLIVNPNTSEPVTALLQQHVQAELGAAVQVHSVTARFGAPYISCEASYAVAAHAALDAWAAALAAPGRVPGTTPDAVLIGCFGDPGLFALRDSSAAPVSGLAEAAFAEAAIHGSFAIVTGGERWAPMLRRLALALGYGDALAGVQTIAPTGAELAADPALALTLLTQACRDTARSSGAGALILGGAGLAGLAAAIQPHLGIPLIDSVLAGARWALQAKTESPAGNAFDVAWSGLSPEMLALGQR
jgi:allantoin racemase